MLNDSLNARIAIVLCDDLLFTSRITATARGLGCSVKSARDSETLQSIAKGCRPSCVILDLANAGLQIDAMTAWLRNELRPMPMVIAYGSHVDAASLRAARAAGCDAVMPRSQFADELELKLPQWLTRADDQLDANR